jgi:hypothetical protein
MIKCFLMGVYADNQTVIFLLQGSVAPSGQNGSASRAQGKTGLNKTKKIKINKLKRALPIPPTEHWRSVFQSP